MAAEKFNLDNQAPSEFKRSWGWLLALGIAFVILGCIGLGMVVSLTLASMLVLGVLFIIAGISQFIDVFRSMQWKAVAWHTLIALLYLVAGVLVLSNPVFTSSLITIFLASVLVVIGVVRIVMAMRLSSTPGWGWLLFLGIVDIALGDMILMQWPVSGLWVIGLFIAVELLVAGWTYIFLALAMRPR